MLQEDEQKHQRRSDGGDSCSNNGDGVPIFEIKAKTGTPFSKLWSCCFPRTTSTDHDEVREWQPVHPASNHRRGGGAVKKNLSVVLEETNSQLSGCGADENNNNHNEYMDSIPNLDDKLNKAANASNPSSSCQRLPSSTSHSSNNSNNSNSSTSVAAKTMWIDLWRALVAALFLQWLADWALFTRARKLITASEEDDPTTSTNTNISTSHSTRSQPTSRLSPSSSSVASSSSSSSP